MCTRRCPLRSPTSHHGRGGSPFPRQVPPSLLSHSSITVSPAVPVSELCPHHPILPAPPQPQSQQGALFMCLCPPTITGSQPRAKPSGILSAAFQVSLSAARWNPACPWSPAHGCTALPTGQHASQAHAGFRVPHAGTGPRALAWAAPSARSTPPSLCPDP